jgi:hypothetical protein
LPHEFDALANELRAIAKEQLAMLNAERKASPLNARPPSQIVERVRMLTYSCHLYDAPITEDERAVRERESVREREKAARICSDSAR